jgi:2-dehydro-3-deoxyphosphogluconate aldolase/(4S)-4-hydroxy-2-oxoglutarate aldolase
MKGHFNSPRFEAIPLVGILRGIAPEKLRSVVEAALGGGLVNLEITMNSIGAADQIRVAREIAGDRMNVGAGTVTSLGLLTEAVDAGASFIVTPTITVPVIEKCVEWGIPVFPGAFSPTEVVRARDLGATMVKVFPADVLGPSYIRSLKAPLPDLRLMPTGGVDLTTLGAFAEAGADAFGVGSPLFRPERIAAGDWDWLQKQCRLFAEACRAAMI